MRRYALFLVFSLVPASELVAAAIASASVSTSILGGNSCDLASSGASIMCSTAVPGFPSGVTAQAAAMAGVGSLSIDAATGSLASGANGLARASASYDFFIVLIGPVSGPVTGTYQVVSQVFADFTPLPVGMIMIRQGGSSVSFGIPAFISNPVLLTSPYTAGEVLEISGSATGFTST